MKTEFAVNDYVVHSGTGVCVVKDVRVPDSTLLETDKEYYTLESLYDAGTTVFTPVENPTGVVRPLLDGKAAKALIKKLPKLNTLEVENEKKRDEIYRGALTSHDSEDWARLLKSMWVHDMERKAEGKGANPVDDKYRVTAQDLLFGELAVVLESPKDDVAELFETTLENTIVMDEAAQ